MALDKPYFETSDAYLFGLKRFSNLGKLTLHLKQIRLPENFFRNFPRLENLHLSGNSVIGLQESAINSLKYLKKFTFSVTSFVGEGWSWTPLENMGKVVEKYFNKLDSLEVLRLSNCFIPELNEDMFRNLTNLDKLYLINCKITRICDRTFSHMRNLKHIDLSLNSVVYPKNKFDIQLFKQKHYLNDDLTFG